jgi:ribonuclease P/MRP protein subunit RPP40
MLRWIQAFLSNRTFSVKVRDSKSYDCTVASGVPQGSVLGPLLFVIYISDLNYIIDVDHVFFADDGKLYGNPSSQFQSIQDSLLKISHWCRDWLIQLNIEKCEVLHLF